MKRNPEKNERAASGWEGLERSKRRDVEGLEREVKRTKAQATI